MAFAAPNKNAAAIIAIADEEFQSAFDYTNTNSKVHQSAVVKIPLVTQSMDTYRLGKGLCDNASLPLGSHRVRRPVPDGPSSASTNDCGRSQKQIPPDKYVAIELLVEYCSMALSCKVYSSLQ